MQAPISTTTYLLLGWVRLFLVACTRGGAYWHGFWAAAQTNHRKTSSAWRHTFCGFFWGPTRPQNTQCGASALQLDGKRAKNSACSGHHAPTSTAVPLLLIFNSSDLFLEHQVGRHWVQQKITTTWGNHPK